MRGDICRLQSRPLRRRGDAQRSMSLRRYARPMLRSTRCSLLLREAQIRVRKTVRRPRRCLQPAAQQRVQRYAADDDARECSDAPCRRVNERAPRVYAQQDRMSRVLSQRTRTMLCACRAFMIRTRRDARVCQYVAR